MIVKVCSVVIEVEFNRDSPERLRNAGFEMEFRSTKRFYSDFRVEMPCLIQGSVHTDLPFSIGSFSVNYGGRLRYVNIGRYCSIAGDFQSGWDEHPVDWATSSMVGYVKDIHRWSTLTGAGDRTIEKSFKSMRGVTSIGNDVWIGHGVFIRAGVSIGDGAIVAARSLVLEDVAPYSVVGGHPAKLIKMRFQPNIIYELARLQWWRYNILTIKQEVISRPSTFILHMSELIEKGNLEEYRPLPAGPIELAEFARVPYSYK